MRPPRELLHELNHQLQLIVGYGDLLAEQLAGDQAAMAQEIAEAARASAELVRELRAQLGQQ